MAINQFAAHFVRESLKRLSLHTLLDADINKLCHEIRDKPLDITPRALNQNKADFSYQKPKSLYVYPSKDDSEKYLEKAEQMIESIHGVNNQAVFEIRGNKEEITCSFYAEKEDIGIIDSAVRNFYPKAITEISEPECVSGSLYVYDFIPVEPFYKPLTSYREFTVSPLNLIPRLFFNIENNKTGIYQIVFKPLQGEIHQLVKQAIDTEWQAMQGIDKQIPPSLQPNAINEKVQYKSPEFKQYYSVCARIILPSDSFITGIKAFIANYSYGSKQFKALDNRHYSQEKIGEMANNRGGYHSGFLVNSHELTSLMHIPFQMLYDKGFNDIFASAPVGDKPMKTAEYKDVVIGAWACGKKTKEIHLPLQREIPHVHIVGVSRSGKSVLLSHIAIEKFKRREAVFVLDPHGDLIDNILRMVPRKLKDDVVLIDFGLRDYTPQITIRGNVDITNPSKVSDDLSESMRDITSGSEKFYGPRMAYYFQCLYFIYCVLPDLNLTDIRLLVSSSRKGKVLRIKVKARIHHPIVKDFLEEISSTNYESLAPVITRLSHLLLDESSLRLFTLETNRISISDIMENAKLCLVNLACGIIGRQRSSILTGVTDNLIDNNAVSRAVLPLHKRKPCTVIKDEFYLGPGDLDAQLTGLAKYGISVVFAHQYLHQVEGRTRAVLGTAGTRIAFRLRREDAEELSPEFNNIDPAEFTGLEQFKAILKAPDETVKVNTPKPEFSEKDCSKEIREENLEKYYLKHTDQFQMRNSMKPLEFDMLKEEVGCE